MPSIFSNKRTIGNTANVVRKRGIKFRLLDRASLLSRLKSTTPPSDTYSVSGTITGPIVEGVTVYALNPVTRVVLGMGVSNALGNYTINNLNNNTNYEILPYVDLHIFSPSKTQVNIAGSDITSVDFLSITGAQYLYDATTISIVDDLGNRLYEAI